MDAATHWKEGSHRPRFPSIDRDLSTDVVVIGGGLTGITTAYLLKEAGVKVVLLERGRCAGADTGHTTAHLTYVTDERLHHLVKIFGKDASKAFWEAGTAAIDSMWQISRKLKIDCEFKWVPGFLHASSIDQSRKEKELLQRDAELASEFGFKAEFLDEVPFLKRPGVRFDHQAKFQPLKYLAPLLRKISGDGSFVFENTDASEVDSDPLTVHADKHKIRCEYLVVATHDPLVGKSSLIGATLFQTKLALYTSYVLGTRIPHGLVPEALFWDTSDPYYYLRSDARSGEEDYVIFGGEDVKTGQEKDASEVFQKLEQSLKHLLPAARVVDRWLGQVVETNDGLPFIGEITDRQFIATGFCGNGFTLGTLGALMARDRYLGQKNPWFELFAVNRCKFHGGTWRYVKENFDYPYYFLRDRLGPAQGDSLDDLKFGEGKILKIDGRKVAGYRDPTGKVTLLSPVCTHLKCIVHWNAADSTWDCPCHGSRFTTDGKVFSGPAETPLERLPVAKNSEHVKR
jgi:glycine/D-amino acid oxidase-like deaminating enzyme/nitrite reductase/ring-hydroxylating ferredoxin subunit